MNPEFPPPPDAEIEARLTALLLGELTGAKAASLRQAIDQNPELAELHDRLKETIGLVREVTAHPVEPVTAQSAPLKLSDDRREQLLAHFKTVTPKEFSTLVPTKKSWWVPLTAAAAIILLLSFMGLPGLRRTQTEAITFALNGSAQRHLYERQAKKSDVVGLGEPDGVVTALKSDPAPNTFAGNLNVPALAPSTALGKEIHSSNIVLPSNTQLAVTENESLDKSMLLGIGDVNKNNQEGRSPITGTLLEQVSLLSPQDRAGAVSSTSTPIPAAPMALPTPQIAFVEKTPKAGERDLAQLSQATAPSAFGGGGGDPLLVGRPMQRSPDYKFAEGRSQSGPKRDIKNQGAIADAIRQSELQSQQALANVEKGWDITRANQQNKTESGKATNYSFYAETKANATTEINGFTPQALVSGSAGTQIQGLHKEIPAAPVPLLGDLPMLGQAFRSDGATIGKTSWAAEPLKSEAMTQSTSTNRIVTYGFEVQPPVSADQKTDSTILNFTNSTGFALNTGTSRADNFAEHSATNASAASDTVALVGFTDLVKRRTLFQVASEVDGEKQKDISRAQIATAKPAENLRKIISDDVTLQPTRQPAPIPQPEMLVRENGFSTFSLNVSDVSFKLAAASLENGVLPDAAAIRSEEFINAFDYRDPAAPAGAPIAFAWERARDPFAHNRDFLRFSLKTAATGRPPGQALNIVLLLDNSGSMERADRVQIIHEALRVLATQLQPQDKLSVVTFARTARLWIDGVPGSQAGEVTEKLSGLTPDGGTNLEDALKLAYETALRHYFARGGNRVVLLTDGAANLGNVDAVRLKQKVEECRKQGIALDCFGIGWEGYNDDLLEVLARNGDGRYGFLNSPEEATNNFAHQLAGALNVAAADVKVQVEFNPARVTAYRQVGYARHQLTKEQFRDNTVNAAAIGAAEAGNGVYAIEVNAAGEGPLATVRCRFRVPGSQDYREQEWVVPFQGDAVALEQASPAMRLAASAAAFSEMLAASPYAGEVTVDQLLRFLNGVPEIYGADTRPKLLESMVRQAKSISGK